MIVVSNKYIPALTKKVKKDTVIVADTPVGDQAIFCNLHSKQSGSGKINVTKLIQRQHQAQFSDDGGDYENDASDVDEDEDLDDYSTRLTPIQSFTGANWRPVFNDRMTMFIAGAPGAGKSYLAKQMISLFPPDTDIMLFTALEEEDGNFADLGTHRLFKIRMTPENLRSISLSKIRENAQTRQVILLFDDVDKISDPKVQAATFAIMNDALANGRGHTKHNGDGDIHVICTSHSPNDYQKTKYTFENCNYVALFPGNTPALQLKRMFEKLGLDKRLCAKMMRLGRMQQIRSIIIHKVVPLYLIYGNKIMLL